MTTRDMTFAFYENESLEAHLEDAQAILSWLPEPPKIVLDLGAHVGCLSVLAAKAGAKLVVAVEPDPDNYQRLVQNVIQNGFWGTIVPLPYAVSGGGDKTVMLKKTPASGQNSLMFREDVATSTAKVRTLSIHEALRTVSVYPMKIDLLKIDIEGAEWAFLRDQTFAASALIEDVENIDLELHPLENLDYFSGEKTPTSARVRADLEAVGFKCLDTGNDLLVRASRR